MEQTLNLRLLEQGFEHSNARRKVGEGNHKTLREPAQDGRIDVLGEVRCSKNKDLPTVRDNAIHLLQQLTDDLLYERVIAGAAACRCNKVQLVDKENGWRYRPGLSKDVAHIAGSMAEIEPFQVRDCCLDETEDPSFAMVRAICVFPEPAGPSSKMPVGMDTPRAPHPSASSNIAHVA